MPIIPDGFYSSFAQYTIILENKSERDELQSHLKENGIPSMVYYPKALSKQDAFNGGKVTPVSLEVTNKLCNNVLSLPMHPYLHYEEIDNIVDLIESY